MNGSHLWGPFCVVVFARSIYALDSRVCIYGYDVHRRILLGPLGPVVRKEGNKLISDRGVTQPPSFYRNDWLVVGPLVLEKRADSDLSVQLSRSRYEYELSI